jgi:hypothetical protein
MTGRRFPPPWSIEEGSACFIVRDRDKQALAYVYFENETGRRSSAKLLTRDGCCEHRQAAGPTQYSPRLLAHIGAIKFGNIKKWQCHRHVRSQLRDWPMRTK